MKNIHVVAAMIRNGQYLFATQRGYGEFKGGWEFPGGKIKEGETPQQALVREIREELDTEISVGNHYKTIEYDYPDFHLTMECYWASVISGSLTLKEHMNSQWLKKEDLKSLSWLPADQTLIDCLEEEGYAIKNLVFDVGYVLLEYRWKDMFLEYGLEEEECIRIGDEIFEDEAWVQCFDRGIKNHEQMLDYYAAKYPQDKEIIAWFLEHGREMRVDRPEIWKEVRRLKEKGYKLYILSNYSSYLFHLHTENLEFIDDMDGMVVSYEPHFVKPEKEIYDYLLDKYDLKAEQCLFFDDRLENVLQAHKVGMDANHVTSREMIHQLLHSLTSL